MTDPRPNVVLFVLDDTDLTWEPFPKTRAIIAERGIVFPNHVITCPLCAPARATILTGRLPQNHGIVVNADGAKGVAIPTLPNALHHAGYQTMLVGKYLNHDRDERPAGWDEFLNDGFKRIGELHDAAIKRIALDFVRDVHATPFFLMAGFRATHKPYTAPDEYATLFTDQIAPRPPSFGVAAPGKPPHILGLPSLDLAEVDADARGKMRMARLADSAMSAIIAACPPNTTVWITTDNGYLLGQHNVVGKRVPYRNAIRQPVWAIIPGQGPRTDTRLMGNHDLAPTIAARCGAGLAQADGQDILNTGIERLSVPITNTEVWEWQGVASATTTEVTHASGFVEYYNLLGDPDEMENLAWPNPSPS